MRWRLRVPILAVAALAALLPMAVSANAATVTAKTHISSSITTHSTVTAGTVVAYSGAEAPSAAVVAAASKEAPVYVGAGHAPSAALATPAAESACPSSYFCAWVNANYDIGPGQWAGDNPDWLDFAQSSCADGTWNDCASSIYNHGTSGDSVEVYQNVNYGGASACIPDDSAYANLANYDYPGTTISMNDSISSNYWNTLC